MNWICESLLKRNEIEFLKQLITSDEKWITYDNNDMKKIVVEARWNSANDIARIDTKKSDAVFVVGLERNRSLWVTATRSND